MEVYSIPVWAKIFEKLHDEQMNHFWRPPLIEKFLKDIEDWKHLPNSMKMKVKTILRCFTLMEEEVIDGIAMLHKHSLPRIIGIMLGMQEAMEGIHTRSYSVIDNALEYDGHLLDELITKRMDLLRWNSENLTLAEQLVHLVFSEGISFNTLFSVFFILEMKALLPQTCTINKEVQSDENLHTKSSIALYNVLSRQGIIESLPTLTVYEICERYVRVDDLASELLFSDNDSFFLSMSTSNSMIFTRIIANSILTGLGYPPLYEVGENPYKFVDQTLVNTLEYFFDKEVVAYGLDADHEYEVESEDDECYHH